MRGCQSPKSFLVVNKQQSTRNHRQARLKTNEYQDTPTEKYYQQHNGKRLKVIFVTRPEHNSDCGCLQ